MMYRNKQLGREGSQWKSLDQILLPPDLPSSRPPRSRGNKGLRCKAGVVACRAADLGVSGLALSGVD